MTNEETGVVLIGMGGHALVVAEALQATGRAIVGYCDHAPKSEYAGDIPYLGSEDSELARTHLSQSAFLVTIGDNSLRHKITQSLLVQQYQLALPAVHPSATISPSVSLGRGAQVQGGVVVNAGATIGESVILNTGCIVEHECSVERFVHIAPGAVLAGSVSISEGAFVGANATVIQGCKIDKEAIVGAGAVVICDIPPGRTAVGNPAKLLDESFYD